MLQDIYAALLDDLKKTILMKETQLKLVKIIFIDTLSSSIEKFTRTKKDLMLTSFFFYIRKALGILRTIFYVYCNAKFPCYTETLQDRRNVSKETFWDFFLYF